MWYLPDHPGNSKQWAIKFFLKILLFYQNFKISLKWMKNILIYSIHFSKTSRKCNKILPDASSKFITCMMVRVHFQGKQLWQFRFWPPFSMRANSKRKFDTLGATRSFKSRFHLEGFCGTRMLTESHKSNFYLSKMWKNNGGLTTLLKYSCELWLK